MSPQNFPSKPGVYLFRDQKNRVIYVGKAKNLKKRTASYFQNREALTPDKKMMLPKIKKIEHIVVDNETEALLLEHNLIKKYRPRYNVVFKDDKSYAYIKITDEEFPRVFLIRPGKDKLRKGKLFGPYTSADSARHTLRTLRRIFPFRSCKTLPQKACLFYYLKLCPASCEQKISQENYREIIKQITQFLKGQHQEIIRETKRKMREESEKHNFEAAAFYRDRLWALQKIQERQKVVTRDQQSQDVVSLARASKMAAINLFIIRLGRLLGKENFLLIHTKGKENREILQSFVQEYYLHLETQPQEIILPTKIQKFPFRSAKFIVPQKGKKKKLLQMGEENAREYLKARLAVEKEEKIKNRKTLEELASYLKLKKIPLRIEAYDISNIQGQSATGSMIVFKNGQASKDDYRRFKIKTLQSPNDIAMMQEVLQRRFKHKEEKGKWCLPNLVIVDGGKGQLSATQKILKEYKLKIPVRTLAKKLEEIYFPNQKSPIILPPASQSLMLVKRIRDEAHRFAITYHCKLRSKQSLASKLDQIPGLGPKKKKLLLEKWGSLENIKKAKLKELEKVSGKKIAQMIKNLI